MGIIAKNASEDVGSGYRLSLQSNNKINFYQVEGTGDASSTADSTTALSSTGVWYHVVAVRDSTTLNIYVNGGSAEATTGTTVRNSDNTQQFVTARYRSPDDAYYFDGIIDELGLWKRALSAAEVAELYNAGAGKTYPF